MITTRKTNQKYLFTVFFLILVVYDSTVSVRFRCKKEMKEVGCTRLNHSRFRKYVNHPHKVSCREDISVKNVSL